MTVLQGEPTGESVGSQPGGFENLIADKVWQYLGLTAQEFKRRWYAGEFRDDPRPAVAALDALMRTGSWQLP